MANDDPKKTILQWQSPVANLRGQQPQGPAGTPPPQAYPPQQAYPPPQPQQAYPPQPQQAYPPQPQQAYPPQPQQAYPPQPQQPYGRQAYPPQQPYGQQAYPPQQPYGQQAYPPQQQAFAPQQPAYAPAPAAMPDPFAGDPRGQGGRPIAGADATAGVTPRLRFIRLTYIHLLGAILVFTALEYLLLRNETVFTKISAPLLEYSIGRSRYNWLVVLGLFMVVGYVADYWARHATSRLMQYLGLGLYVVAESLIFVPLLFIAEVKGAEFAMKHGGQQAHIIRDSAYLTLALFTALTASVLISKKDFSFMRGALAIGSAAAMVLILISIIAGFNLGLLFSVAMVILAAGYVLYYTSQILAHYHPGQHVAASLALFSAIALMFWYVVRIMMKLRE